MQFLWCCQRGRGGPEGTAKTVESCLEPRRSLSIIRTIEVDGDPIPEERLYAPVPYPAWDSSLKSTWQEKAAGSSVVYQHLACGCPSEFEEESSLDSPRACQVVTQNGAIRPVCVRAASILCGVIVVLAALWHARWGQMGVLDTAFHASFHASHRKPAPIHRHRHWLICGSSSNSSSSSDGSCWEPPLAQWRDSPAALASRVADFTSLPGVPPGALELVAKHWQASPPKFRGARIRLAQVAAFARELLESDPFKTGDKVPYLDFRSSGSRSGAIAVTQRQLAFLVVNILMGNDIPAGNGLSAALQHCGASLPGRSGLLLSLLSFLAVLSQELAPGSQGTTLLAATPRERDGSWRDLLANSSLEAPLVCIQTDNGTDCGLKDFMSGGTPFQALTDIAGGSVGGGAQLCVTADGQDESLVQFYSEVLAFSFFVDSTMSATWMLPVPWTLLGARRYLRDINGQSTRDGCGKVHEQNWLNEEISSKTVNVPLGASTAVVAASAFVAVASNCSQCLAGDHCDMPALVNNRCETQRQHLDSDVDLWYQAYEPSMYHAVVQEAFRSIVQRIGTGPWGAGVWYGDSQLSFLTVWLATSLLSGTRTTLDYYIYDHFCENPGNQCFVLGAEDCASCLKRSRSNTGVEAFWCGTLGAKDMVAQFQGKSAKALYQALASKVVSSSKGPPKQVFDLLAADT